MTIGFLSMPLAGHLNPMTALARRLQSRGHKIAFIGIPNRFCKSIAASRTGMVRPIPNIAELEDPYLLNLLPIRAFLLPLKEHVPLEFERSRIRMAA
jgi:hypothetical protein